MTEKTFLAAQCRCGASGYLLPADGVYAFEPPVHQRAEAEANAVPMAAPGRAFRLAVHEAAHAAIAHVHGIELLSVTIDGMPCCVHVPILDRGAAVAVALAGDHGERIIIHGREFKPSDPDVVASFDAVRQMRFGGCDRCTAAFELIMELGLDATDADLLFAYRSVEAMTMHVLRELPVAAAIRHLADVLMECGTVDGVAAHHIIDSEGVMFSSRHLKI